ncbi:MAG TPA: hypothetical protein VIH71_16015 [Solirubrobacteraceae bacterium]
MIEAQQSSLSVDDDADGVEANRMGGGAEVFALIQPRDRKSPQTGTLAWTQPWQRLLIGAHAPIARGDAARLDLGENECHAIECDQVDLACAGTNVASDDREAEPLEVRRGEVLAQPSCRAARVRLLIRMLRLW